MIKDEIDNLFVNLIEDLNFVTSIEHAADQNKISKDHVELIKYGMGLEEWPDPIPLSNNDFRIPYPIDALPDPIRKAVEEVQNFVQCPISLVASSALTAISLAVQGLADVRRAEHLIGPISLYFLSVAESGERKTTCDNYFIKPIRNWENRKYQALKMDIEKYNADVIVANAKIEAIKAQIKKIAISDKSTSDLHSKLNIIIGERPIKPLVPKVIFTDTTPEALIREIALGWHSAGLLSNEGGIIFGGHSMKTDSAMRTFSTLNMLWENSEITVDRRTIDGFKLQGARLTIGISVQNETISAFLNSTNGLARGIGFIARFLISAPATTQGSRLFKKAPESLEHLAIFHNRIENLLNTDMQINERGEIDPKIIGLSPEGSDTWIKYHNDVELALCDGGDMEDTRDIASKSADNVARIAANFHIFTNGLQGAISADLVNRAAKIATWHLYEGKHFLLNIESHCHLKSAIKLDSWLIKTCNNAEMIYVSRRYIQRYGPYSIRDGDVLDKSLKILIDAERIRIVEEGKQKNVYVNIKLLGL